MQAYGWGFAQAYNLLWSDFARQVAPRVLALYAQQPLGQARQPVLDLCCGTGQLAQFFLEQGYPVTGLDLSAAMLAHARQNNAPYVASGRASFVQADAAAFALPGAFGLVVATYDALNHLPSLEALRACFRCAAAAAQPGGLFVFDLNTRLGLARWNGTSVQDRDGLTVVMRGSYDGQSERAHLRLWGYARRPDGLYERFEEEVYNTVFEIRAVLRALAEAGWSAAYAARLEDLTLPLEEPGREGRVFIVARQPDPAG